MRDLLKTRRSKGKPMKSSFQEPQGDYGFDNPSGIFVIGGVVLVFWAFAFVQALLGHLLPAAIGGFLGLIPAGNPCQLHLFDATGKTARLGGTIG